MFPCHEADYTKSDGSPGSAKEPYWQKVTLEHGYKDATDDGNRIFAWWKCFPRALVGIACAASRLFVLDLDRHPGSPDGVDAFDTLVRDNGGQIVTTLAAQTTSGNGQHLIFTAPRMPPGFEMPGTLAPGIDIKYKGYICTRTLPDGRAYTWQWRPQPTTPAVYPPAWIAKMLLRHHENATADRKPQAEYKPKERAAGSGAISPGADFNNRASWESILTPKGFKKAKKDGHWTRPNGTKGHTHFTTEGDKLWAFTTDCKPFENGRQYSKFAAYALLNHGGDFKAAARALAADGYGSRLRSPLKTTEKSISSELPSGSRA